jgi:SNF2 family DNA or RNA helicase
VDRVKNLKLFTDDPKCLWFVASAATAGKGNNMVCAKYVVYYSSGFKLEHRLQSEDRTHRIGQLHKVTYIDLIIPKTIDERVVRALRDKRDIASEVLRIEKFREYLTPVEESDDLRY